MVTYAAGVQFTTNVGTLSRDMATAAQVTKVFGTEAATSLSAATVAQDEYTLASQRVSAAQLRLAAMQERLIALQRTGTASTREMAVAQTAFVTTQERLLAAQTRQAELARSATQTTAATGVAGHRGSGVLGLAAGLVATEGAIKIKDAIEAGVRQSADLQAINSQLATTLSSTGNVANTSTEGIDRLSQSISAQTGITEEATRSGALLELTFTGIRNEGGGAGDVFDRAAKTAADLAIGLHLARGGAVDYTGAMQLLGRALNDPVAGMQQLRRAGVSFTADQKTQIENLAKTGQMLQAQELILELVGQKFGNAAQVYGHTAAGAYAQTREALNQLEKQLSHPLLAEAPPVLGAIRDTLGFLVDHPVTLAIGEVSTGIIALAFAAATLEKAFAFLKESQYATALLRMLFPLRSVERAVGTLAVEEDTQAMAAGRAAFAQNELAGAMSTSAIAGGAAARSEGVLIGEQMAMNLGGSGLGAVGLAARMGPLLKGGLIAGAGFTAADLLAGLGAHGGTQNRFANFFGDTGKGAAIGAGIGALGLPIPVVGEITTAGGAGIGAAVGAAISLFHHASGSKKTPNVDQLLKQMGLDPATQRQQANQQQLDQIYQGFDVVGGAPSMQVDLTSLRNRATSTSQAAQTAALSLTRAQRGLAAAQLAAGVAGQRSAAQILSAEDRLNRLRSAKKTDPTAIAAAEGRLAVLRQTGSSSAALRLANAEDTLTAAKARSAAASAKADQAEKDVTGKRTTTALSVDDVLKRIRGQNRYQRGIGQDLSTLAIGGVGADALAALQAMEKQAPGTIHEFATHLTKKTEDALNAQFVGLHADAAAIQKALTPGFADGLVKAAIAGSLQAQATLTKLAPSVLAGIYGPAFSTVAPGSAGAFIYGGGHIDPSINQHRAGRGNGPFLDAGGSSQPIGVRMGATSGSITAPHVVVHVHTTTPTSVKHETNINGATFDSQSWEKFQRRARYARAVAG